MSSSATPFTPTSQSRWGRCCLYSMGTIAVLMGLIGIAAWFSWTELARPWLQQKRLELAGEHPWIDAGLDYLVSGKVGIIPARNSPIPSVEEGSRKPGDFPKDVYVPPGAEREAFRTTKDDALAVLTFDENRARSQAALARTYSREMERLGWEVEKSDEPHDGLRIYFSKSRRIAEFLIVPVGNKLVRVWIHCSTRVAGTRRSH